MNSFIGMLFLGLLIAAMGIVNMRGNISTLHWYHRQRVTEENRKPFGKQVGAGTLIIGIAMVIGSILLAAAEQMQLEWLSMAASVLLVAAVVIGLALSFHAMLKYNKGIF